MKIKHYLLFSYYISDIYCKKDILQKYNKLWKWLFKNILSWEAKKKAGKKNQKLKFSKKARFRVLIGS